MCWTIKYTCRVLFCIHTSSRWVCWLVVCVCGRYSLALQNVQRSRICSGSQDPLPHALQTHLCVRVRVCGFMYTYILYIHTYVHTYIELFMQQETVSSSVESHQVKHLCLISSYAVEKLCKAEKNSRKCQLTTSYKTLSTSHLRNNYTYVHTLQRQVLPCTGGWSARPSRCCVPSLPSWERLTSLLHGPGLD